MRLLERVKALEAKYAPDIDLNLVCKQLAEQTELMLAGKGIYSPDAYIMPLWKSQEDFDKTVAEQRKDYEILFGPRPSK